MSEKVGIEKLTAIVEAVGEGYNVLYKVTHGGGVLSALALTDELSSLGGLSKDAVVAEVKDLSQEERKQLLQIVKNKVSISDKALEAKIEAGVDCLDEVVSLGFEGYETVMSFVDRVKGLVEKVKALGA